MTSQQQQGQSTTSSGSTSALGTVTKLNVDFTPALQEFSQDYAGYIGYPRLVENRIEAVHGQLDRISARKGEIETLVQLIEEENIKSKDFLPRFLETHSAQLSQAFAVVDKLDELVERLSATAAQLENQVKKAEDKQRQADWSKFTNWKLPRFGITTEFGDLEDHEEDPPGSSSHQAASSTLVTNSDPNLSKLGIEIMDTHLFFEQLRNELAPQEE